jgi:copper(I)-binding protein
MDHRMKKHHSVSAAIALTLAFGGAALTQALSTRVVPVASAQDAMAAEYKVGDLVISGPVAKAPPPNAPVAGGFMKITNNGSQADRLVSASASFSPKVEIHEMTMEGDVMKMRPIMGGLEIPAGGSVELKPGGYHVMFMGLAEPLKDGESRKVVLTFEKAGAVEVDFTVKDMQPGGHMNHGG